MDLFTNPTFEDAALIAEVAADPPLEEVDAEEIVCRDARALVDFFDSEVGKVEVYGYTRVMNPEEVVNVEDTGRLLTLIFDAGQPGLTTLTALRRLRELYLEQMSDRVAELVAESAS